MTIENGANIAAQASEKMATIGSNLTLGSSVFMIAGFSYDVGELMLLITLVGSVSGLMINWFYKHKAQKTRDKWYKKNTPKSGDLHDDF